MVLLAVTLRKTGSSIITGFPNGSFSSDAKEDWFRQERAGAFGCATITGCAEYRPNLLFIEPGVRSLLMLSFFPRVSKWIPV